MSYEIAKLNEQAIRTRRPANHFCLTIGTSALIIAQAILTSNPIILSFFATACVLEVRSTVE